MKKIDVYVKIAKSENKQLEGVKLFIEAQRLLEIDENNDSIYCKNEDC